MLSFVQAAIALQQPSRIMRPIHMVATVGTPTSSGYEVDRFAGRYPVGKNLAAVDTKAGFQFERVNGDVRVLGGACSEGACNAHTYPRALRCLPAAAPPASPLRPRTR